jgi:phytoene dehydrogenase-like protein
MLPLFVLFVKYGRKSCAEYFKGLNFKSHRLSRSLNTLFGESDFSALAIIMMLGWFDQKNAGYIIGGSLPLVTRMVKKYTASGGKINTGKKVVRIVVENNIATGILLADGTIVKSDHVISASDGHSTIFNLLEGKYLTAKIRKAYETWPLFTPLVQVSFGVDMEVRSKYSAETIMAVGNRVGSTTLVNGYILMNYSFDPTMAPSGKSVIIMRFESPWDTWKEMNEIDYKNEKEKIKTDANRLLESNYPGISDHIEVVDVATPLTNVRYTRSWKGAYEGFLPSSRNITKTLDNTLPGLKNFYMAGQWLYPGGGIPPSVLSGKKAIRQICRGEKRKFTAG